MDSLITKKCVPCEGGIPPLNDEEVKKFLFQVPGWQVENKKIFKSFVFKNFKKAINFINLVADIAESEDHHPDIYLFSYKNVKIELSTHAINGLSENDFIVAAKIDKLKI